MCLLHVLAHTEYFLFPLCVPTPTSLLGHCLPDDVKKQVITNATVTVFLKSSASCLKLPLLATRLITSCSLQWGMDFYLWGCCNHISLREAPCQDCCFPHCTWKLWHVTHSSSQRFQRRRENLIVLDKANGSHQHVEHYRQLLSFLDHFTSSEYIANWGDNDSSFNGSFHWRYFDVPVRVTLKCQQ